MLGDFFRKITRILLHVWGYQIRNKTLSFAAVGDKLQQLQIDQLKNVRIPFDSRSLRTFIMEELKSVLAHTRIGERSLRLSRFLDTEASAGQSVNGDSVQRQLQQLAIQRPQNH